MIGRNRLSIGAEISLPVSVPPSVLFDTVIDIDASPSFIEPVLSVERIGSRQGDAVDIGTRWKEIRKYKGKPIEMIKTVHATAHSAVDVEKSTSLYPQIFAVNISFPGSSGTKMANTSTLIVNLGEKEGTSQLAGTFAAVPGGPLIRFQMLLFGRSIRKSTTESFRRELENIAREAERRYGAAGRRAA